jgi:hypothetical protein
MPTITNVNDLVINTVENQEVYDYMLANNLVKDNELYVVEGDDEGGSSGGGNYEQHAWHKKGYSYNTYKTVFVKQPLEAEVVLMDALDSSITDTSVSVYYSTSATITDESITLNSPYSVTCGRTGAPAYYVIPISTDSFVSTGGGTGVLISRLNSLANQSSGVYIKTSLSDKVYHVVVTTGSANPFSGTSSTWQSGYFTNLKLAGGTPAQASNIDSGSYGASTVLDEVIDTYEGIDEVLYSSSRDAYTEGDDGKGLIYTYLGIPSEVAPLGARYGLHAWQKRGYVYSEYAIEEKTFSGTVNLLEPTETTSGNGYCQNHYVVKVTNKEPTINIKGAWVFSDVRTFDLTYNVTGSPAAGGVSVTVSVVDSQGEITAGSAFMSYLQSEITNNGSIYIQSGENSVTEDVYRVSDTRSIMQTSVNFYVGGNNNYYPAYRIVGNTISGDTCPYFSLSIVEENQVRTYEGVEEIVYSTTRDAFVEGDNENGLSYKYLGIPADSAPLGSTYGMHCWRRYGFEYTRWDITSKPINTSVTLASYSSGQNIPSGSFTIAKTLIDATDGVWNLDSPTKYYYSGYSGYNNTSSWVYSIQFKDESGTVVDFAAICRAAAPSGLYILNDATDDLYYIWNASQIFQNSSSSSGSFGLQPYYTYVGGVSSYEYPLLYSKTLAEHVDKYKDHVADLVYSVNRNAYPEGETPEGLKYQYCGVPAYYVPLKVNASPNSTPAPYSLREQNSQSGNLACIEESYEGTGTSADVQITLPFKPVQMLLWSVCNSSTRLYTILPNQGIGFISETESFEVSSIDNGDGTYTIELYKQVSDSSTINVFSKDTNTTYYYSVIGEII